MDNIHIIITIFLIILFMYIISRMNSKKDYIIDVPIEGFAVINSPTTLDKTIAPKTESNKTDISQNKVENKNNNYSTLKTNTDPNKKVDFEGILKKLDEEEKAYLEKKLKEKPEPPPKCNNESINEKFRYAKDYMKPFELSCDFINKKGKPDTSTPVDPMLFYKDKYKPIPLVMDDPTFRGFNVAEYSNHANIWDVGRINLKQDIEYPVPSNFTFKTSPAFRK